MNNSKVVGIHGTQVFSNPSVKALPVAVTKLRDLFKSKMMNGFRLLFDNADDAFFSMADKAESSKEQALYFESMRQLRLAKRGIANHCVKSIINGFNSVYEYDYQDLTSHEGELLEWSLLDDEDLEVKVAVESMISRVEANSKVSITNLNKRFETLIPIDVEGYTLLPYSPKNICDTFVAACSDLDFSINANLIVFKLFEKYILSSLPEIYEQSNQLLIQLNILPELESRRVTTNKKVRRPSDTSTTRNDQSVPVLGSAQFVESECGSQFEELRSLLHVAHPDDTKFYASQADNIVYIPQNKLLGALSDVQALSLGEEDTSVSGKVIKFDEMLSNKLCLTDNSKISQLDNDVINLVSMLFEFILDDRQLRDEMKALIGRLQIPILKVAIMDRSFFDRGGHPARRLLNELAASAIGWNPAPEGRKDPLKEKIISLVDKVLKEFENNLSIFEVLLNDFLEFGKKEKRRGDLIEQRTKDSENGKAITQKANADVSDAISKVLSDAQREGQIVPSAGVDFIKSCWARVMSLHLLKEGENSKSYKDTIYNLKLLVDSIAPKTKNVDSRGELLALIPLVAKNLRAGLSATGLNDIDISRYLLVIERLHSEALNSLQNYEEFEKSSLDDEAIADLIKDTLDIESDFNQFRNKTNINDTKESLGATIANDNELKEPKGTAAKNEVLTENDGAPFNSQVFERQIDSFTVGTWFEIAKEGDVERCKLAAYIKAVDKFIFVNRSGVKICEHSKSELVCLLKEGKLQVLNDGLLFDRALESVIGSLRQH